MHLVSPSSVLCYLVATMVALKLPSATGIPQKIFGNSKVVLFQGNTRYEIDSSFCTVGVAFNQPELFSCACVNGIWAFYGDETCGPPLALVAGNNYCFQLPNIPIREVTSISSPMRALSSSLTIMEPNLDSVKTKIYRNIHMAVDRKSQYVTLNSSWTLLSPRGDEGVCLMSREPEYDPSNIDSLVKTELFCSFSNISEYLIRVGSIEKGCTNDYFPTVEPIDCLPVMAPTSEDICRSQEVLDAAKLPLPEDLPGEEFDFFRHARSNAAGKQMRNIFEGTLPTTTTTTTEAPFEAPPTTEEHLTTKEPTTTIGYPEGYEKAPAWLQKEIRERIEQGLSYGRVKKSPEGSTMDSDPSSSHRQEISPAERTEVVNTAWSNFQDFLNSANRKKKAAVFQTEVSQPSEKLVPSGSSSLSNTTVVSQLLRYLEKIMRSKLRLKTSLDAADDSQIPKALKLLFIAKDIVKNLCPIVLPDFFDLAVSVFSEIQLKFFRWTEFHLKNLDFKRIQSALVTCRERSKPLVKTNKCSREEKGISGKTPSSSAGDLLELPESHRAEGKEPIIESAWKIFTSVHSYCYKFFDQYYNDHHKFTTLMYPLFSNNIQRYWFSNLTADDFFYASIIGDVKSIWAGIDKCAGAAREASTYPFHLTRPSLLSDVDKTYTGQEEDIVKPTEDIVKPTENSRRRRRAIFNEGIPENGANEEITISGDQAEATEDEVSSHISISRSEERDEDDPWKNERRVLDGKGFCLKKYNEAKIHLGYGCNDLESRQRV